MAKYINSAEFLAEARDRFQFLCHADFLGPEEGEYVLSYSAGLLGIELHYDDRDGRILTIVRSSVGDRNARAGLQCLYVSASLGVAQDIRDIARSRKAPKGVLETHAAALRKLLPILGGADAADLLLRCHGQ
jgi:hypothetical protein